jgi:uncharacterized FAD-dependent dehydrogenase
MSTCESFDVAVIGCGIAGIYAAYELVKLNPGLRVAVLEQGEDIAHRSCPIVAHKTSECLSCATCAIMRGFGGAVAYSDGKYNFTNEFGGWLKDYRPEAEIMALSTTSTPSTSVRRDGGRLLHRQRKSAEARKKALENDLHLLAAKVKHLVRKTTPDTQKHARVYGGQGDAALARRSKY